MIRRALFGLTALIGVASAQSVPNVTWSFSSPRSAPVVEWSPNGGLAVLSTNSSVEVYDGTTFKLKWARTVTGALPTFLNDYPHPDRAKVAADSKSIWIRSAANGFYTQVDATTGATLSTHAFSDWSGDYVIHPITGTVLVAIQVSVSGGVETLNYRTYDPTTWNLVKAGTLTHPYVPGVDIAVGKYGSKVYVGFYDKLVNASTGAALALSSPGAGLKSYNVALDPDGGVLQTVVSTTDGSVAGTRRLDPAGAQTWATSANLLAQNVGFAKTAAPLTLGVVPKGSSFLGFNYLTGESLFDSNAGLSGASFTFNAKAIRTKDARIVSTVGTGGLVATPVLQADASGVALTTLSVPTSGVATIAPYTAGALISGNGNFIGSLSQTNGNAIWSASANPTSKGIAVSKSGAWGVAVYPDRLDIFDTATGTVLATSAGTYVKAIWVANAQIIAVKPDGSADRFDYASGILSFRDNLNKVAFKSGLAITNDNGFAVGYANGNIHLLRLSNGIDNLTPYPIYGGAWDSFFRIVPTTDNRLAILEGTSTGLKWTIYKIVSAKLVADVTVPYTPPFTLGSTGNSFAGDFTNNARGLVSAFFAGKGVDLDGTPQSELTLTRVSDGKLLGTYTNVFSYVNALRFSPDGSSLYVLTGGAGTVSSDDSGPQALHALKVPAWLDTITAASTTVPSGGTVNVTPKLIAKAPFGGTTVNLTVSGSGASIAPTLKLNSFAQSAATPLTVPAVATDTTFTVTATIDGFPEVVTTTVTALAPAPATVTFSPASLNAGKTSVATLTATGVAPTGGLTVALASSSSSVHVPPTVVIPAGSKTATFTVTTDSSGAATDATISATANSTTASGVLHVNVTPVTFTLSPTTVVAGNPVTGTVKLESAATQDVVVALSTSTPAAPVPSTVTVLSGSTTATFTIATPTSATGASATLTATFGSVVKTAPLTVTATPVSTLTLSPSSLPAGNSTTATLTLGGTPTGAGQNVAVTYAGTGVSGPATVTVPAGSASVTFTVTTTAALAGQSATVTATLGASSKAATLTITPTQVTGFTVNNDSVTGGSNSMGTITISAPAPTGGLVVTLTNNKPALITAPASITVPAGTTSVNFSWATAPTLSSQTASYGATIANVGKTASQTVVPPKVVSVSFATKAVTGGTSVIVTVTLDGPAPAGYGITLGSSNPSRLSVPSVIKPTTGNSTATTTVTPTTGAETSVTLTASGGGGSATDTLKITP